MLTLITGFGFMLVLRVVHCSSHNDVFSYSFGAFPVPSGASILVTVCGIGEADTVNSLNSTKLVGLYETKISDRATTVGFCSHYTFNATKTTNDSFLSYSQNGALIAHYDNEVQAYVRVNDVMHDQCTTFAHLLPVTSDSTKFVIDIARTDDSPVGVLVTTPFENTSVEIYQVNGDEYKKMNATTLVSSSSTFLQFYNNTDSNSSGLFINSSNPVSIMSIVNRWNYIGYSSTVIEQMTEQIPPISQLGTVHIVPSTFQPDNGMGRSMVRVVASEPNTVVQWTSSCDRHGNSTTITRGRHVDIDTISSNCSTMVVCSKPCLVKLYLLIAVRLANGTDTEGRLEAFYNGTWITVCDDYFDNNDAKVACLMLGFTAAVTLGNRYGAGTGQIWFDDFGCAGPEKSLASCSHRGFANHSCDHSEDVSIGCNVRVAQSPMVMMIVTPTDHFVSSSVFYAPGIYSLGPCVCVVALTEDVPGILLDYQSIVSLPSKVEQLIGNYTVITVNNYKLAHVISVVEGSNASFAAYVYDKQFHYGFPIAYKVLNDETKTSTSSEQSYSVFTDEPKTSTQSTQTTRAAVARNNSTKSTVSLAVITSVSIAFNIFLLLAYLRLKYPDKFSCQSSTASSAETRSVSFGEYVRPDNVINGDTNYTTLNSRPTDIGARYADGHPPVTMDIGTENHYQHLDVSASTAFNNPSFYSELQFNATDTLRPTATASDAAKLSPAPR